MDGKYLQKSESSFPLQRHRWNLPTEKLLVQSMCFTPFINSKEERKNLTTSIVTVKRYWEFLKLVAAYPTLIKAFKTVLRLVYSLPA